MRQDASKRRECVEMNQATSIRAQGRYRDHGYRDRVSISTGLEAHPTRTRNGGRSAMERRSTVVAPRLGVFGGSNNRGAVTFVSLGFSTRGFELYALNRTTAERRQLESGEVRRLKK